MVAGYLVSLGIVAALSIEHISVTMIVIFVSELVAIFVIWHPWRSADFLFMKIGLSVIAVIPILGPVVALWIANFPNKAL